MSELTLRLRTQLGRAFRRSSRSPLLPKTLAGAGVCLILLGVNVHEGALAVAASQSVVTPVPQPVLRPITPLSSTSGPTSITPLPAVTLPGRGTQRLEVPVVFQVTRTRMLGGGATTLTESYRETWVLDVQPGAMLTLSSRRASVAAYQAEPGGTLLGGPKALRLSERDLARLVGVQGPSDDDDAVGALTGNGPVTLQMGKNTRGGSDIPLNFGDEEHYAVHIELGSTTVF